MNANQIAAEVKSMVASGLVTVKGNTVTVSIKRDCMDTAKFDYFKAVVGQVWDALKVFNAHSPGQRSAWQLGSFMGRGAPSTKEQYMHTFVVPETEMEAEARCS